MADTNYGIISQRTAAWAAVEMLSHAESMSVISKYGMPKPCPKNKADTVKFRRAVPFAVSTVPVSEGVNPTPHTMTYEDVTVQLLQYGDSVKITDKVADMCEDPVLANASELSGEQAGETLEMVVYGKLIAGTNVFYAAGTERTDVNTKISINMQRKVTRDLKGSRAKKISKRINASPNYGTSPVDAAFFAFGHTDLEGDIRSMTGFVPVESYGQMKAEPFEVGKVEDVRYILAPHFDSFENAGAAHSAATTYIAASGGTKWDVYPVIYLAKEAFGLVPLKGSGSIVPMVVPIAPSASNPLGLYGFVSWKAWFAATILNQAWMARLEVCATN